MTTLAIVAATSLATQNFSTSTSMDVTTSSSPMGNDTSAASRGIIRDPMDDLGIVFVAVAITLICVLIVGVIAGCIRNCCCQPKKSKGLELKSSARKHGPGAFVKDADFAYIDIESTNSKDRKEVNDKADTLKKSLERYDSVHIGKVADENVNMMNVTSETQTSSSLGAQSKTKDKHHDLQTIDENEDIEGPVRVSDSSSQPTASSRSIDQSDDDNHSEPDSTHSEPDSRRGYTPPRRLNNQLFVAKTTNIDQSQQSPVHSSEPSKSVVYVVSDPQEDERMSSAKHTPDDTDKSTSNAAAPAGPGVTESGMSLVAYIDLGNDEQGALFEDPRLYSSYL